MCVLVYAVGEEESEVGIFEESLPYPLYNGLIIRSIRSRLL